MSPHPDAGATARHTITEQERLQLLGLAAVLRNHLAWVDEVEDAIVRLLGDPSVAGDLDAWQMSVGESIEAFVERILRQNNVAIAPTPSTDETVR